jgi:hypothetical protein
MVSKQNFKQTLENVEQNIAKLLNQNFWQL